MDKRFTLVIAFVILYCVSLSTIAGPSKYGEVLYRVNCGGIKQNSIDNSPVNWMTDNSAIPCPYVDIGVMGNRTYGTTATIALDPSVPSYVPPYVFNIERNLFNSFVDSLEYHFPVPYGKKVEVRLYFSELYFDKVGDRIMDIYVENQLRLKDFDIIKEVGKNVGVMKSFQTTSDGLINIFLNKVRLAPKINGIEIIALEDVSVLHRVNAGGAELNSWELSGVKWVQDDNNNPCAFIDTSIVGNRTLSIFNATTISPSVPTTTPSSLFRSQRALDKLQNNDLTYTFPVPAGQKVDIRLYFAELFIDNPGERVMDVLIEDKLYIDNLDLIDQHGKLNGVCKEITVISDGNLAVRIRKEVGQPIINGIEIVESTKDISIATSIISFSDFDSSILTSYPNPFKEETNVSLDMNKYKYLKVINSYGIEIPVDIIKSETNARINLGSNPDGIYFLLLGENEGNFNIIKLVKY